MALGMMKSGVARADNVYRLYHPSCHAQAACGRCALKEVCLPRGLSSAAVPRFEEIAQRSRPLQAGEHLFRAGDSFCDVAVVRVGCFKSYLVDSAGQEHVSGFSWPGEIVGLDAIHSSRHTFNVIALDASAVCDVTFNSISSLARLIPHLQSEIFSLMSRRIIELATAPGQISADERIARFLVSVSNGFARRGYSGCQFILPIARKDIASYLRLTAKTVSRVLDRFQRNGWLLIDRQQIRIFDLQKLRKLAVV